jgi:aminoglycoside 3-N-acetyltransferase
MSRSVQIILEDPHVTWHRGGGAHGPAATVYARGYATIDGRLVEGPALVDTVARICSGAPPARPVDQLKEAIPAFNGHWALVVLWPDGSVLAATDRARGVPLFYTVLPDRFVLASTAEAAQRKRTALEIWRRMRWDSPGVSLGALCDALVFLADHDFLHLRPVLARDDYLAALRRVGLSAGAVVMAHVSLSRFGYVEGGEDTVLDALLEALGPEGTLVMPTLSCSWVGRPPFDPRRTPSRVGAVTEAFRRRPGVLRSPHPTHSVAALGPRAAEITRVHSPERPVFAPEGAFGKLYDLDAWILLLAPLAANTCMHMGEERAGVPLVDIVARAAGRGRAEARVVRVPWHVNFRPHYDVLFERGLVRSTPLGEDTIHLVRVRDAVDAAEANLRRDPLLAAAEGCQCAMCRRVRAAAR